MNPPGFTSFWSMHRVGSSTRVFKNKSTAGMERPTHYEWSGFQIQTLWSGLPSPKRPCTSARWQTRLPTATARKSFTGELEFSDIISDFYLAWFASWVICIKIHGCFVICILSNFHHDSWVICINYDWFPCSETSNRKTCCWTWRESSRLRTLGGPSMHPVPGSKHLVFAMILGNF